MDNELYHYGIKGMKWGVRRYQNKDGSLTDRGKKQYSRREPSPDRLAKQARRQDYKNRRTLSDADLKKKIERLKMEKQFKDLTQEDIAPGRKATKEVLATAGKRVAGIAAAGTMAYAVKVAMTGNFDPREAAAYIAANPNKKK